MSANGTTTPPREHSPDKAISPHQSETIDPRYLGEQPPYPGRYWNRAEEQLRRLLLYFGRVPDAQVEEIVQLDWTQLSIEMRKIVCLAHLRTMREVTLGALPEVGAEG